MKDGAENSRNTCPWSLPSPETVLPSLHYKATSLPTPPHSAKFRTLLEARFKVGRWAGGLTSLHFASLLTMNFRNKSYHYL
jgi:hypothetical protein